MTIGLVELEDVMYYIKLARHERDSKRHTEAMKYLECARVLLDSYITVTEIIEKDERGV